MSFGTPQQWKLPQTDQHLLFNIYSICFLILLGKEMTKELDFLIKYLWGGHEGVFKDPKIRVLYISFS